MSNNDFYMYLWDDEDQEFWAVKTKEQINNFHNVDPRKYIHVRKVLPPDADLEKVIEETARDYSRGANGDPEEFNHHFEAGMSKGLRKPDDFRSGEACAGN
jgi:hypothetical protein